MKRSVNQSTSVIILNSVSIIFVALAIISFFNVVSLSGKVDQSNNDRFDLTFNANRFMDGSAYLTNEVRAFAVTGDKSHYDNYWNEINTLKNRDIGVEKMIEIGIEPDEQAKIDAMSALSNQLVPLESAAMDMTMAGKREEAIEAVYGAEYYKTIGEIQSIKNDFLIALDNRAEKHVNDLIAQSEQAQRLAFIFIIIVAVLQVINAAFVMIKTIWPLKKIEKEMEEISKGNLSSVFTLTPDTSEIGRLVNAIIETKSELNKYIRDISDKLGHISKGNLNLTVDLDYIGEFAPIKSALVKIVDSLNDTIMQINLSSHQVSSGSQQISSGSQTLAQGSVEQAAAIQQLSESISEVTGKTTHGADMAQEAASLSGVIKTNAEKANNQMDDMMQAVTEINDASTSIGKVIKVIDDIAFQTNILALNAAVEAARAGQHGKGFAVVADEVRNLAAKSAEAAKNTGGLITNSTEKAKLGFDLATETVASLQNIVDGIDKSAELINRIAKASSEQADSISHINRGIDQIENVVRQNSATAEESAAASEEMSSQSILLEQLVSNFHLREQRKTPAAYQPEGASGFALGSYTE